jgi:hypothetical protein
MLGVAMLRGIEPTGVRALAGRCGAGVGPLAAPGVVDASGAGAGVGVVEVQAARTRTDVTKKRRMGKPYQQKESPRELRGGFRGLRGWNVTAG